MKHIININQVTWINLQDWDAIVKWVSETVQRKVSSHTIVAFLSPLWQARRPGRRHHARPVEAEGREVRRGSSPDRDRVGQEAGRQGRRHLRRRLAGCPLVCRERCPADRPPHRPDPAHRFPYRWVTSRKLSPVTVRSSVSLAIRRAHEYLGGFRCS